MSDPLGPWIVAGMHRSGTSLVASALLGAGVDIGPHLLPGDARNPPGYFEDLDFLELDRRLVVGATRAGDGGHRDWGWTESERLDTASFAEHRDEGRLLLSARLARGRRWGFKDPRATLLLDFWLSLAPNARFILPYRLPWAVADSLQRIGADVFLQRPDYGYRIWTFYNRHLLDFHRRHPDRAVLVSIDTAVRDGSRMAELLRDKFGLECGVDALAPRFESALWKRFSPDDPLVPLVGAAHPRCFEVLAALDAEAELPATGLWDRKPPRPRRPVGEPQVAVVIPCFDHGEFAIEAVASVERCLQAPYELVLVDDGSREPGTRTILATLQEAGYDVRWRPHRGVAAARNHGFAAVRAPFVIPLDADNQLLPGFVEHALAMLADEANLAAVYGDRVEFGARSGRVEVGPFDADLLVSGNYVDGCAVIRRQVWEDCGGYDEQMPHQGVEDWEFWLHAIARGWSLRWLVHAAFAYRVRPQSMLHQLGGAELAAIHQFLLSKHHALYLAVLRRTIAGRKALEESSASLSDVRAELSAHKLTLAACRAERNSSSSMLEDARRQLQDSQKGHEEAVTEVRRLEQVIGLLERQQRHLHGHLQLWQERLGDTDNTRAARLRALLVRLRSRIEGRARTEPGQPCVVGATGGSGTRIFARLAERGGLYIGRERNEFEDALPLERFLDRWLIPFWQTGGYEPPHVSPPGMDDDLLAALAEHLAEYDVRSGAPYGWKSPRSIYLLPFLAQRFPDLRFLHVLRDGRDMALSSNQMQLARYGSTMLSPIEQQWLEAERSIALWSRINILAADLGGRMRCAYLRVRFEDLCADPVRLTRRVFRFFGLPGDPRAAARLVEPPSSLGRWRRADAALVRRLEEIGAEALRRFGYRLPTA